MGHPDDEHGKKKAPQDADSRASASTHGVAAALLYEADCWLILKAAFAGPLVGVALSAPLVASSILPQVVTGLLVLAAKASGAIGTAAFGAWLHATWKLHREAEAEVFRAALLGGPGRIRPYSSGSFLPRAGPLSASRAFAS